MVIAQEPIETATISDEVLKPSIQESSGSVAKEESPEDASVESVADERMDTDERKNENEDERTEEATSVEKTPMDEPVKVPSVEEPPVKEPTMEEPSTTVEEATAKAESQPLSGYGFGAGMRMYEKSLAEAERHRKENPEPETTERSGATELVLSKSQESIGHNGTASCTTGFVLLDQVQEVALTLCDKADGMADDAHNAIFSRSSADDGEERDNKRAAGKAWWKLW